MGALFVSIIGILNAVFFFLLYKNSGWHSLLPSLFAMAIASIASISGLIGGWRSLEKKEYKMTAGWALASFLSALPFVWMIFTEQISQYWSPR